MVLSCLLDLLYIFSLSDILIVGFQRDYIDKVCGSDGVGVHSVQDFRDLLFPNMAFLGHFCGVAWIGVFPCFII